MSRVDMLASSRDSLSVKFMEFTKIVSRNKGRTAVFFEGEDEKYYSIRINSICQDMCWLGINCGGKSNVLKMRKKIRGHDHYCESSCLFFIDADFDDNAEEIKYRDVYITPCYSIENMYISDDAFDRILSAEFGITEVCEHSDCFEAAKKSFNKCKSDYLIAISEFNFLIKEIRKHELISAKKTKLNINNIKFEDIISIDLTSAKKIYDERNPCTFFKEIDKDLKLDYNDSQGFFNGLCPEKTFRGKQHLDFLRTYISLLKIDRCKRDGRVIFKESGSVKLQLTKSNCLSELSQYADTPKCLAEFLRNQGQSEMAA
jgi:hypothetical protein